MVETIGDILMELFLNEGASWINQRAVINLITSKRYCNFYYVGDEEGDPGHEEAGERTDVQIVCYGKGYKSSHSGEVLNDYDYIRAWIGPNSKSASAKKTGRAHRPKPGWRMFRLDRIKKFTTTTQKNFTQPPASNYNSGGDGNIATIIAMADFTPGKSDAPVDLRKGGPKKPKSPNDKKPLDKEKEPKKPVPLTPSLSTTDKEEPDDTPEKPEPKQHYSSTRTPKPVVKYRNGKPVVTVRENFENIVISIIKDFIND